MKKFKHSMLLFIFLFIFWVLLAGTDTQELIAGFIVSLLITLIFSKTAILSEFKLSPKSIIYALFYPLMLAWELVKSNFDVAFRVLNPKLPINPGIVKVKTKLQSRMGRIFLANSITLTPGTFTVETKGEDYYIHWIYVTSENIEDTTKEIISKFEKYLEVMFG